MDLTIRQATDEDQDAIVDCVQAAYSKYIERIGKKPAPMLADYKALIAQQVVYVLPGEEGIRGVLVMMPQERSMFVENIAVDPRCQGQGLGKMLMAFVEQQARKAHLGEIRLYTNELMTENLLFYQKLGFEEVVSYSAWQRRCASSFAQPGGEEEGRQLHNGYRRVFLRKALI